MTNSNSKVDTNGEWHTLMYLKKTNFMNKYIRFILPVVSLPGSKEPKMKTWGKDRVEESNREKERKRLIEFKFYLLLGLTWLKITECFKNVFF